MNINYLKSLVERYLFLSTKKELSFEEHADFCVIEGILREAGVLNGYSNDINYEAIDNVKGR